MTFELVFLLAGLVSAASPSPEQTPRFSIDVDAVTLDVVVTDQKGNFVKGLEEEDFIVLEEGVRQDLAFFTSELTPVTVLVLLDSSSSVRANLRPIQKAANRFLDKLSRGDKARVGFFHERVVFGPRFTGDIDEHIAMINNMRPHRSTHLFDAVIEGLEELQSVPDRKALLLFTDGDDEGSQASMEDALEAARRSDVSAYTIGFMGWSFDEGMYINQEFLSELARYTGGQAFFPTDEKEMQKAFDRVQDELHRTYRMAYVPPDKQGGNSWRNVVVRLANRRGLVVRTRLGYYSRSDGRQ